MNSVRGRRASVALAGITSLLVTFSVPWLTLAEDSPICLQGTAWVVVNLALPSMCSASGVWLLRRRITRRAGVALLVGTAFGSLCFVVSLYFVLINLHLD